MQDEQKQIEEMAYSICTANRELIKSCRECPIFQGDKYSCVKKEFAEKFYNAGCRMQSNTVRDCGATVQTNAQLLSEYRPLLFEQKGNFSKRFRRTCRRIRHGGKT